MKKFEVRITNIEKYIFDSIEAETDDEAYNKAFELLDSDEKYKYLYDSDGESTICEIT